MKQKIVVWILLVAGCGFEPSLVVTCDDGVKNGSEADVDCGGGCPDRCADGGGCIVSTDCESSSCIDGACREASCDDGVKNAAESDVDCGASCDAPCGDHQHCATPADCTSGVCTDGTCIPSTCGDGILQSGESDVDCGGGCPSCDNGKACVAHDDCASRACVDGSCGMWVEAIGPSAVYTGAVDAAGNLFAVGIFDGLVDFGGGTFDSASGRDVFLAMYAATGQHLWSTNVGPGLPDSASFDASGNVVFAGYTFGGNFGGDSFGPGLFVAKYSATGDYLWSRHYPAAAAAPGITTAANGDILLTGSFSSQTMTFGGTVLTNPAFPNDSALYIARLSAADGSSVWARTPLHLTAGVGRDVALDPAGDVLVVGSLRGSIVDFGCGIEPISGNEDAFIAKLDGDTGACAWARADSPMQGLPGKRALAVVADASGNLFVAGSQNNSAETVFVEKYAGTDGSRLWARPPVAGLLPSLWMRAALDPTGDLLLAGTYTGASPSFGGSPLMNADAATHDIFLAKYASSDGTHLHSQRFGGLGDDHARALGRSPATNGIVLMGSFQQSVDFGTGPLQAETPSSAFFLSMGSLP